VASSTIMSKASREAFLAGTHVGVLAVAGAGRGPLAVPVWYGYEPGGDVWLTTDRSSVKAALLAEAGRATLCVQDEAPPYRYVSVEGPVTSEVAEQFGHLRVLAVKYLGLELGERYAAGYEPGSQLLVRLAPERWLSADYTDYIA